MADADEVGAPGLSVQREAREFHARRAADDALPVRLARLVEQFAHREQADHDEDDRHALQQVRVAVGEAPDAGHRVGADGRDHQADERGDHPLGERALRDRGDHREPEHAERGVGGRLEGERELRQRLRQEDEEEEAGHAADEARHERDAERLAREALLLHLVAVDEGRGRVAGAGRADQDRRDRAAVLRADIGRDQEDEGRDRVHRVGEGQEQRHHDGGRQAGERAAEDAPGHAEDRHQPGGRRRHDVPGDPQRFHDVLSRRF